MENKTYLKPPTRNSINGVKVSYKYIITGYYRTITVGSLIYWLFNEGYPSMWERDIYLAGSPEGMFSKKM